MPVTYSGMNSDINTEDIISKLVEVEKRPIYRLQNEKKDLQYQKEIWKDFNKELTKLNNQVKELYGFNRVFNNKKVVSPSDEYFTASVQDNAAKGDHKIEILNLAQAHKILSDELPCDKDWPGAVFTISVGSEKAEVSEFKSGGKLDKLAEAINSEAGKLVLASVIKTSDDKEVLSLEALKTGEKNNIELKGDRSSDQLFNSLGLSTTHLSSRQEYNFNGKIPPELPYSPEGWSNTSCLVLDEGKRFTFILPEKMDLNDTIVEFLSRSVKKEEKQEGRLFGKNIGDVSIRDLVISGADVVINKISKIMLPVQEEAWMKVKSDKAEEMMILLSPG
ncbi:MAG: flagellar cap protein FliD N-terminal domain-containing protein, partial [bacterium]|nr:flagellar cap protein FliD N-terminal domain-containing protein [bacterium]